MATFTYTAIDAAGASIDGAVKAKTIGEVRTQLVGDGVFPVKIEERRGLLAFELVAKKVKKKALMQFTRQLAVFVKAGIPITDALQIIGDETTDVALQRTIVQIIDDLRNGETLSDAAGRYAHSFPTYYVAILQSAELTGRLDDTLDDLARYLERELETRSKVTSALSYPAVVMVLALFTVAILAGYVLPQFKPLFEELDADLPLPTRVLLFLADLFTTMWYIPATVIAAWTAAVIWLCKSPVGRRVKDRLALRIPVTRGIVEYAILERFCRILGAMVKAGVPLPDGLRTTTESIGNSVYRVALGDAREEMLEGGGFAAPLAKTGLFPAAARQMFKVGEETGTLDEQLEMASLYFDRELEHRIKRFTTMFEPIMIVFVGLIVGFVAVALVSTMYGVLGNMKETA